MDLRLFHDHVAKMCVFEHIECQEATWAKLSPMWAPKGILNRAQQPAKTEQKKKEKKSEAKRREVKRGKEWMKE